MSATPPLPIEVRGHVLPGKVDPSSIGSFANANRAEQYARMLADTGDYAQVHLIAEGYDEPYVIERGPTTPENTDTRSTDA